MVSIMIINQLVTVSADISPDLQAKIVAVDPYPGCNNRHCMEKYKKRSNVAIYTLNSLVKPIYVTHEELMLWQR
jgi:hypothetical protein